MSVTTVSYINGVHTRTVDQDASLTQKAMEDALKAIAAHGKISIRCGSYSITRDQVMKYGTPEALAEWDARFRHDKVYTHGPSLSGEVK